MVNTMLREVRNDRFIVKHRREIQELPFDYGFICTGMKASTPVLKRA